jgi:hypothetical protein
MDLSSMLTAEWITIHWYYLAMFFGLCLVLIGGFTRHLLIVILGIVLIVFAYLYMTSGGVLVGWLTGTGLALWARWF